MATVISLSDAQRIVLDACEPLVPTDVDLADAVGLVLAADVTAAEDVPPFANSAVDGYAVIASDTATAPIELAVVGELAAGAAPPDDPIVPGETIRIMTGAPMPPGADAVVMVEDSERARRRPGAPVGHRRRRARRCGSPGGDVRAGEIVFTAGTVVTPAVAGVLASINARSVRVIPAATVAVLSTGDELVDDGIAARHRDRSARAT